jgi:predicted AAA+ superfamily ATPase
LAELITVGGYPESVLAPSERARSLFLRNFTTTVLGREAILDAGSRRDPATLRAVFAALAARTAAELNLSDLSSDLGLTRATVTAHVALLETLRQVVLLEPWATNAASRAKRRPKIVLADSGVAASQLGASAASLRDPRNPEFGPLLETFVIAEILRQTTWTDDVELAHYRDRDGREVDLIVRSPRGIVGVEIKATASPDRRAVRHLEYLAARAGPRWRGGVLLHSGAQTAKLGDRIHSVPLSRLWA